MEKLKAIQDAIRGINQALTLIELASEAVGRETGGYEISLARTDCQSARHWLRDGAELLREENHPIRGHQEFCMCGNCHTDGCLSEHDYMVAP